MHLADSFIWSDLHCIQGIHFYQFFTYPGDKTYDLWVASAVLLK